MKYLLIPIVLLAGLRYIDAQKTLGQHEEMANTVCFSPDGALLVSGSNDNKIKVFEVKSGKLLKEFTAHSVGVKDLVFHPDGSMLYSAGRDNLIRVWDCSNWKRVNQFEGHEKPVNALAISPDGNFLFSGSDDLSIRKWDIATGKAIDTWTGHNQRILSLNISGNGEYLVSTSGDRMSKTTGNLIIWNLSDGTKAYYLEDLQYAIQSACLNESGSLCLYGGNFSHLVLIKWSDNKIAAKKSITSYGINSVILDGLSAYAAGTFNGEVYQWPIGKEVTKDKSHDGNVNKIALSPDGTKLASAGTDGKIVLRNLN